MSSIQHQTKTSQASRKVIRQERINKGLDLSNQRSVYGALYPAHSHALVVSASQGQVSQKDGRDWVNLESTSERSYPNAHLHDHQRIPRPQVAPAQQPQLQILASTTSKPPTTDTTGPVLKAAPVPAASMSVPAKPSPAPPFVIPAIHDPALAVFLGVAPAPAINIDTNNMNNDPLGIGAPPAIRVYNDNWCPLHPRNCPRPPRAVFDITRGTLGDLIGNTPVNFTGGYTILDIIDGPVIGSTGHLAINIPGGIVVRVPRTEKITRR
ncbi:hypothetical protein QBC45DRAFT_461522 [Copromyces sp. CBS 386.78]|nr:hypothetical protein QBC45DRAFT_461522 [Copromyces sp. CBS 386.78]